MTEKYARVHRYTCVILIIKVFQSLLVALLPCCQGWSIWDSGHTTGLKEDAFTFMCRRNLCPYYEKKNLFVSLHKMSPCDIFGYKPRKCQSSAILTCQEQQVLGACHGEALETCSALSHNSVNTTELCWHWLTYPSCNRKQARAESLLFIATWDRMVILTLEQTDFARWQKNMLISLWWAPSYSVDNCIPS